jgi:hypothetical protein
MSQDIALQQGVLQLQTESADLWTCYINTLSPLRVRFLLILLHGVCYCINMASVLFYFLNFILNLVFRLALFLHELNKIVDCNSYLTLVVSFIFR